MFTLSAPRIPPISVGFHRSSTVPAWRLIPFIRSFLLARLTELRGVFPTMASDYFRTTLSTRDVVYIGGVSGLARLTELRRLFPTMASDYLRTTLGTRDVVYIGGVSVLARRAPFRW